MKTRKPIVGEAFAPHFMNDAGRIASYVAELRYYRPRGFSGLAAFVTDHGNVAVRCYSRGRMTREIFDVV